MRWGVPREPGPGGGSYPRDVLQRVWPHTHSACSRKKRAQFTTPTLVFIRLREVAGDADTDEEPCVTGMPSDDYILRRWRCQNTALDLVFLGCQADRNPSMARLRREASNKPSNRTTGNDQETDGIHLLYLTLSG
jgi:hypothetical protein